MRAISATRVISSISSRGLFERMVKAKRSPIGRPCMITEKGKRSIVAAVEPPKMMIAACLSQ
ncbi:hypothetical protein D3C87_2189110 [compost metagenome]